MKTRIAIITGATSAGKSDIAVEVAKRLNGEVVSADSMQVYRGMDIGTGKLSEEEMDGVRHHLIDVLEPNEPFNVSVFRKMASEAIEDISSRGKLPILAGGTGFYIRSLLYTGEVSDPGKDPEYRQMLKNRAAEGHLAELYDELGRSDPVYHDSIHPNNTYRIIRALEYCHATGRRYSDYCMEQTLQESDYEFVYFVLTCDRGRLYERIDRRVDKMVDAGLEDEVRRLLSAGVDSDCTSMNAIGYKEMCQHIENEISLEEAAALIKKNTRHYAVRQLTWFRNQKDIIWIDTDEGSPADRIESVIRERFYI